ncbi:hypothetical protein HRbin30_02576 [bacterium HR30]|nr:hypothetical protein HRbin30_02576 [bacterium HR30]
MGYAHLCSSFALLGALAGCTANPPDLPRAQEDPKAVLAAVSVAQAYVCGQVGRIARIDRTGYRAEFLVQQVLSGMLGSGERLEIAWEELATQRAPRFAKGETVLVALSALPATALWLHRFPPQLRDGKTFAVAAQGDAFLREPRCERFGALKSYVALEPNERTGRKGAQALAELGASSDERLAMAALEMLGTTFEGSALRHEAVTQGIARALGHGSAATRKAALDLARRHQLKELRAPILQIAQSDSTDLSRLAWEALLSWKDPELDERLAAWSSSSALEWRVLAAKVAAATDKQQVIEQAIKDPSPLVRQALAEHLPPESKFLPWLLVLLGDPEQGVQRTAAIKIAQVGPAALSALEEAALRGNARKAAAAVLALAELGETSQAILERLAAEHPEESVRQLAALALGRPQAEH